MDLANLLHAQTVAECLRAVVPGQAEAEVPVGAGELAQLEKLLAEYVGANSCVAASSGTAAMMLALEAAGVREGDSVLCTSFGFLP